MIHSMTGYARVETTAPWGRLSWEMRSVNHRYLDVQLKLPEDFRVLEGELRQAASARLSRGKIECGLRYVRESAGEEAIELDRRRLAQLKDALDTVTHELGATTAADPVRVLSFPGVMREQQADFAPMLAAARKLFEAALADFTAMRAREGERLKTYIEERCQLLAELVAQVRARYPLVREQWLQRLRARCAELGVEVEPQRLAQEVALNAQRLDVEEEMSRLLSHLQEVRQALERGESVGRRLDFLMQELNREANTLSSKSQDAEMTRCAVEMKVAIEQIREQVQNIE
ncbi:TIGR00255 family protein [Solimonas aquatica]|uniref:TIGR00255 family protein n=1 Tax=Solimonas aquatica TaxID=489703 RepID=A0A1H9JYU4_9GAMM|nr:YicC/YloC family endoribonuclease [Solimonas aquatica]SEQ92002.1 TIGR00255 family protein [Solimonas aquatica]